MTKLTIIGAGSAVFTRNIFTDLMFIDDFKKMDIALVDIDEKRLKISHELLDVIAKKLNASPNINHTLIEKKPWLVQILCSQLSKLAVTNHQQ